MVSKSASATARSIKNRRTNSSSWVARSYSQSRKRACISCAALRVKVIARISPGCTSSNSRRTMRDTSSQVLPLPAQASTTTEFCGSSAVALSMRLLPRTLTAQTAHLAIGAHRCRAVGGQGHADTHLRIHGLQTLNILLRQFLHGLLRRDVGHAAFQTHKRSLMCAAHRGITCQLHILARFLELALQHGFGLGFVIEHALLTGDIAIHAVHASAQSQTVRDRKLERHFGGGISPSRLLALHLPRQTIGNHLLPASQPGECQIVVRQRVSKNFFTDTPQCICHVRDVLTQQQRMLVMKTLQRRMHPNTVIALVYLFAHFVQVIQAQSMARIELVGAG